MEIFLVLIYGVIFLFGFPIVCGYLWSGKETVEQFQDCCEIYILGWIVSFATFEVIAVPMTFFKASLSFATFIWTGFMLVMTVMGLWKIKKNCLMGKRVFGGIKFKRTWLSLIIVLLIALQCILQVFFQHIDDDDAWYVGTAVTSYVTDTINVYSPYTGDILDWKSASPYILSPFPVFWAMIARICHVHPTVLMHTIAPVILVCMAYMVYYILGKQFFKDGDEKVQYFLVFMCLLNLFGFSSTRTTAAMLLLRVWQGKAMMAAILIPALIYYMNQFKGKSTKYAIQIWFTLVAMDLASSMGVFLGILMIGIYICIPLLLQKRLKESITIIWTTIPSIILGVAYTLIR